MHAWAVWRVYKITGERGAATRSFLESAFQKLLMNFTWWVNRKDSAGRNLFAGGFLGLDNIGVFRPLEAAGRWQLARAGRRHGVDGVVLPDHAQHGARAGAEDNVYEDIASKFFEHFVSITRAINTFGRHGLWDAQDGFYYDRISLSTRGEDVPLKVRSIVGLMPLIAVTVLRAARSTSCPTSPSG